VQNAQGANPPARTETGRRLKKEAGSTSRTKIVSWKKL
jgi:hypothetical protein